MRRGRIGLKVRTPHLRGVLKTGLQSNKINEEIIYRRIQIKQRHRYMWFTQFGLRPQFSVPFLFHLAN